MTFLDHLIPIVESIINFLGDLMGNMFIGFIVAGCIVVYFVWIRKKH